MNEVGTRDELNEAKLYSSLQCGGRFYLPLDWQIGQSFWATDGQLTIRNETLKW